MAATLNEKIFRQRAVGLISYVARQVTEVYGSQDEWTASFREKMKEWSKTMGFKYRITQLKKRVRVTVIREDVEISVYIVPMYIRRV